MDVQPADREPTPATLTGLSDQALRDLVVTHGGKQFQARQLAHWIYKHGAVDFDYERRFETPEYQFRRADHAHFFLRGVPTIYFYGGGDDYHQPSDDADGVEYEKVRTMAEVLVDLIRVTDTMTRLPVSDGRS